LNGSAGDDPRAGHPAPRAGGDQRARMEQDRDGEPDQGRAASARVRAAVIIAAISGTATPAVTWANTVGPAPRIRRASRSITARSAPTWGARSILLITSRSLCVIPGPPLRGT